jgi:hypothetical protein
MEIGVILGQKPGLHTPSKIFAKELSQLACLQVFDNEQKLC